MNEFECSSKAENSLRKIGTRCYEGKQFVAKRNHRSIQKSTGNENLERLLGGCFEQKHGNSCIGSIESINEQKVEQKYSLDTELLYTANDEIIEEEDFTNIFIKKEVEFGSEEKQNITDISIFNEDNIWGNSNDSVHQYVDTAIPCNEVSMELVKKEHDETIEEHEVFIKEDPSIEFHSCKREVKPITNHILEVNIFPKEVFSDNGNQFSEYLAVEPRNECAKCIKKKDLKSSRLLKIDENGSIKDGAKQCSHEMNEQFRHEQDVEEQKLADFVVNNQELKCETVDSQTSCVESIDSEQKPFKCLICDYEAISILDYTEHAKEVHFSFKCKLCPFKSYIKTVFDYHYNSVHSKLRNYKCQYCDYASKLKSTLKKHIAAIHLQNLTYKCDLCDYAPKRRSDLKRHVEVVHLKFKSFHWKKISNVTHKCGLCDYGSSRRADLKRHVDAVHLKCKTFKCNLCESRSFSSNYKLKSHMSTVHSMNKNV